MVDDGLLLIGDVASSVYALRATTGTVKSPSTAVSK